MLFSSFVICDLRARETIVTAKNPIVWLHKVQSVIIEYIDLPMCGGSPRIFIKRLKLAAGLCVTLLQHWGGSSQSVRVKRLNIQESDLVLE